MSPGRRYDVIVVGAGSMGSSALYHLARRGLRVLGLERYGVAHDRGSMHGLSRIIRLAYHEHPDYVPLLRRAYELWRELEAEADVRLLEQTGSLEVGRREGPLVSGTLRACEVHGLPFELLERAELEERFPAVSPAADMVGVFQPDGGFVRPEAAVRACCELAVAAGAELRLNEPALDWGATENGVTVTTASGTYAADRLVLAPGAWAPALLRLDPALFSVERQVVAWFSSRRPELTGPDRLPVFIVEDGQTHHYGFPALDGAGVKLGRMHYPGGAVSDPGDYRRDAGPVETEPLAEFLAERIPAAAGPLLDAQACLFTNTPDRRFVIDLHPTASNTVVASVCSGHGFKFAPVVGEILADLAVDGRTGAPIDFLRLSRFDRSTS